MKNYLQKILVRNRFFLTGLCLFLFLGLIVVLMFDKGEFIWFFSQNRSVWADRFFKLATLLGEYYSFLVAFLILLFIRYGYAFMVLLLGLTTIISTNILKSLFLYPRPYTWMLDTGAIDSFRMVEGIYMSSGLNSFPSGHTLAACSLLTFLSFITRSYALNGFFLGLVIATGISRIYLGMHFLQDILFGALCGGMLGIAFYTMAEALMRKKGFWKKSLPWFYVNKKQSERDELVS